MTLCTATTEQVDRIKYLCASETLWLDNINTVWVSDNYDLIMALAARHRIGVCFADIYSWNIWEKQQREGEKYVTTTNVEIAVTEAMKLCRDMTANDYVREMIHQVLTWLAAEDIRKIHKHFKK